MPEPALSGPDFDRDPSPAYAWLRERPPYRVDFPGGAWAWLVTRYDDAVAALTSPALVNDPAAANLRWRRSGMGLPANHRASLGSHMINADEPDHARLRRACTGAFTPRRMRRLRERVQRVTDRLPNARPAVPADELSWWPSPITRGLYNLPIELD